MAGDDAAGLIVADVAPTLTGAGNSTGGDRPPGTQVETAESLVVMSSGQANAEISENGVAPALTCLHETQIIAFDETQMTHPANHSVPKPGDPCHPLAKGARPPAIAFDYKRNASDSAAEELSPTTKSGESHVAVAFDCKRGGEVGEVSPPLRAMNEANANANAGGQVAVAIPITADALRGEGTAQTPSADAEGRVRLRDPGFGVGSDGDPAGTISAAGPGAVAVDFKNCTIGGDIAGTLDTTRPTRGGGQAVAFKSSHFTSGKDGAPSEVAPPLSADADKGDQDPLVFESRFARNGRGAPEEVVPPLKAQSGQSGKGDAAPLVAFQHLNGGKARTTGATEDLSPTLNRNEPSIQSAMQVRRLTPKECERLQGFRDDYTLITFRGKPAADGPRYKALGNSMAVPCMSWIGQRIQSVQDIIDQNLDAGNNQ